MKYLYLLLIFFKSLLFSQTFYVDSNDGNDKNIGTKTYQAWKSIERVNIAELKPGDSVLFKRDCIWREELRIPASGSVDKSIYFGAYGAGALPKIMGSERISIWIYKNNNIWKSPLSASIDWLWFIDNHDSITWGNKVTQISKLRNQYDFYIDSSYVHIFSEKDPNTEYRSIEKSLRDFGIISGWYKKGKSNIIITELEIAFTKIANLRAVGVNNWSVNKIISHHSGGIDESEGQGIQFEGGSSQFADNIIFENGQHGFFLSSFGNANIFDIIIENNIIYNNYHTAIDLMIDGGDKYLFKNVIVRRNLIYDSPTFVGREIGIQVLAYNKGLIEDVTIHHNLIVDLSEIGISILKNSEKILVHNNSILNTKSSCINIDNFDGYVEVFNNIGINNNYYAVLFVHNTANKLIDNNIWFTNGKSDTRNTFVMGNYYDKIEEYRNLTGFDLKGSFRDPKLLYFDRKKIQLRESSIAINSGKPLKYKYDYYGKTIFEMIDIGAIEFMQN